jgi:hypothetical protein
MLPRMKKTIIPMINPTSQRGIEERKGILDLNGISALGGCAFGFFILFYLLAFYKLQENQINCTKKLYLLRTLSSQQIKRKRTLDFIGNKGRTCFGR